MWQKSFLVPNILTKDIQVIIELSSFNNHKIYHVYSCLNKDIETFDREREFIENEMFVKYLCRLSLETSAKKININST